MFEFIKKIFTNPGPDIQDPKVTFFDLELTAVVIAYEIARSDGEITEDEMEILNNEIRKIAKKTSKKELDIFELIEVHSKNSVSFHEYIEDINKNYTKEDKLYLIEYLWKTAYADKILEVDEERLIRRVSNLINIKDVEVLKLKSISKPDS